jgi:Tat protein translocase TatB subunit
MSGCNFVRHRPRGLPVSERIHLRLHIIAGLRKRGGGPHGASRGKGPLPPPAPTVFLISGLTWYPCKNYRVVSVDISFSELIVVFLVALLLFGPEQLPQIARGFGKVAGELRKGTNALRREWYNAVYPPAEEIRRDLAGHAQELRSLKAEVIAPPEGSVGSTSRNTTVDTTRPEQEKTPATKPADEQ